jgi:glutamyl-tRNA synthetase
MWPLIRFLFEPPVDDQKAWAKVMDAEGEANLRAAVEVLRSTEPFDTATLEADLTELLERLDTKPGKLYQPLRVAITGTTVSPGIFESLAALGRETVLERVNAALARLQTA